MCVIWYYIPTRAGVNTARGGEGRDLDTFTDRLRFLHIDIVYPYIPYIPYIYPHNASQIPKSTQGPKPRKTQIRESHKFFGIDKIYTYIINMLRKIINIPFLLIVGFITIVLGGLFGIINLFRKKKP